MQKTLTAAMYLTHSTWLTKGPAARFGSLKVSYDYGDDMDIPAINPGGIIIVSVLLGLFIVSLFAMALYASHVPTWTSTFKTHSP